MKTLFSILFTLCFSTILLAQKADSTAKSTEPKKSEAQVVEASCGQCQFGMKGKGCDLAVRIDGKSYWVEGTDIHSHGDAHGKDGFCNAIRKAKVEGKIEKDRFKATSFVLLPAEK